MAEDHAAHDTDRTQPQIGPDKPGDEVSRDADVQEAHAQRERRPEGNPE